MFDMQLPSYARVQVSYCAEKTQCLSCFRRDFRSMLILGPLPTLHAVVVVVCCMRAPAWLGSTARKLTCRIGLKTTLKHKRIKRSN